MQIRTIYLAGGCFWGVQAYFSRIEGVLDTQTGYANGLTENPSYTDVCRHNSGHAETVRIRYNADLLSLTHLLRHFFSIIDPTSHNRQGNDIGSQYRSGIYYSDTHDLNAIKQEWQHEQQKWHTPLAVEILPVNHFFSAETEHQHYLSKNPNGYCHIDLCHTAHPNTSTQTSYHRPTPQQLAQLSPESYRITQERGTEYPFSHPYTDCFEHGIYVDIVSGEPLFASDDKFHSGCGWASFCRPIAEYVLTELPDHSHGMQRTEIISRYAQSHLGHVFPDAPPQLGGLRYCINGGSLHFIPQAEMQKQGYGEWLQWLQFRQNNP